MGERKWGKAHIDILVALLVEFGSGIKDALEFSKDVWFYQRGFFLKKILE